MAWSAWTSRAWASPAAARWEWSARFSTRTAASSSSPAASASARSALSQSCASVAAPGPRPAGGDREAGGFGGDDRLLDLAEPLDQVGPLAGLQHLEGLAAELVVGPEQRRKPDVDVVGVIGQRHSVRAQIEQADDLVRAHRAL